MGDDREDVDCAAGLIQSNQSVCECLQQEERAARIDGENSLPCLGRGIEYRSPVGDPCTIDKRVDRAGKRFGVCDQGLHRRQITHVGLQKTRLNRTRIQRVGGSLPSLGISINKDKLRASLCNQPLCDGQPQPLPGPGNKRGCVGVQRLRHAAPSYSAPVFAPVM